MTTQLPPSVHYVPSGSDSTAGRRRRSYGKKVSTRQFYEEYHGHTIDDLTMVHGALRQDSERACCFLVGDSSMDNKYWLDGKKAKALNGYEDVLTGNMVRDISYHVNKSFVDRGAGEDFFCLNTAVEESTLGVRKGGMLLEQDEFVRDNVRSSDIIVCSVGGNDIALRPTFMTIMNMVTLLLQPQSMISSGWAIGIGHFISLFKNSVEDYLRSLCTKQTPKVIVVCMIYYLDETPGGSWADRVLSLLGYDRDPSKLQLLIRKIFEEATSKIDIEGTTVVPFPMFTVLDGKNSKDYEQRVEPSVQGGKKLGEAFVEKILAAYPTRD